MSRWVFTALITTIGTLGFSNETIDDRREERYCKNPGYDSRDTTVISMMGWGISLFAGIAVLVSLLENNPDKTSN